MGVRQMLDIARRYRTVIAMAMVDACCKRLGKKAEDVLARSQRHPSKGERPRESVDWERMVRSNSDTRHNHC